MHFLHLLKWSCIFFFWTVLIWQWLTWTNFIFIRKIPCAEIRLSDIQNSTSVFICLLFVWHMHPFSFILAVSLYFKRIIYRQYLVGPSFSAHSLPHVHLSSLMFNAIVMVRFRCIKLLLVFYSFLSPFSLSLFLIIVFFSWPLSIFFQESPFKILIVF